MSPCSRMRSRHISSALNGGEMPVPQMTTASLQPHRDEREGLAKTAIRTRPDAARLLYATGCVLLPAFSPLDPGGL